MARTLTMACIVKTGSELRPTGLRLEGVVSAVTLIMY